MSHTDESQWFRSDDRSAIRTVIRWTSTLLTVGVLGMTTACGNDVHTVADTAANTAPDTVVDTVPEIALDVPLDTVAVPNPETAAFCDAMISAQQAVNSLYTDRTAENLAAIPPFLDRAASTAPDDLPAVSAAGAVVRRALDGDFTGFRTDEFLAAQTEIRYYLVDSCPTDATLNLRALEYAFEDVPATVDAGRVRFHLDNHGADAHELTVLRLAEGEERTPREIWQDPADPDYRHIGRAAASSGESVDMVVDLEVGKYAVVCLLATGHDMHDHHISKGMFAEFVVG